MDNGFLENDRNRRLKSFDPTSTFNPPFSFDSTYGVGKNPWSTNSNIWRSTTGFTDGVSDTDPSRDHRMKQGIVEQNTAKSGSSSLLVSSENEVQTKRSNVPWNTATPVSEPMLSKLQLSSPVRQRSLESHTNGHISHTHSETTVAPGPSRLQISTSQLEEYALPARNPNKPYQDVGRPRFSDFQPSFSAETLFRSQNGSSVNANHHAADFGQTFRGHANSSVNGSLSQVGARNPSSFFFTPNSTTYSPQGRSRPQNNINGYRKDQETDDFVGPGRNIIPETASVPWVLQGSDEPKSNDDLSTFRQLKIQEDETGWSRQPGIHTVKTMSRYTSISDVHQAHYTNARQQPPPAEEQVNGTYFPTHQGLGEQTTRKSQGYYRNGSFGGQVVSSPPAEHRTGLQSLPQSTSTTPPTLPESLHSASGSVLSSRTSLGYVTFPDRKLRNFDNHGPNHQYFQSNPLQEPAHYHGPVAYDYPSFPPSHRSNPLLNPYLLPDYTNVSGFSQSVRFPIRNNDSSQIIRSPLLEDFRTNSKTNRHYELRDIYDHVVEFSGDQHGSRFIQQKLESANSDEKDRIFAEIYPNSLQLMTDVFGNYVVQKFFEHGNQSQKKLLANQMKNHVLSLSLQMYGCRVVQRALEFVLTDQQASMVKELEGQVMRCVKDQNGNHVIQKAIERVPAEHVQFIVDAFQREVQRLATHPYGCRVIQRMLEYCVPHAKQSILKEIHACVPLLITDQFGNYVIQHVIENGDAEDRRRVVSIVQAQILVYSKHKFASNVVEKSIEFADEPQRRHILHALTALDENAEGPVLGLMRDQYGNYVIQKVLQQLKGAEREALVQQIKSQLGHLKRISYGKQIAAIEKIIFEHDHSSSNPSGQSSALPSATASTAASTVEGHVTPPRAQGTKVPQPHEHQIALPLQSPPMR